MPQTTEGLPQLNRWLGVHRVDRLTRARGLLVVPETVFDPTDEPWNGVYSKQVIQYNYSLDRNLSMVPDFLDRFIVDIDGVHKLDERLCWCIKNVGAATTTIGDSLTVSTITPFIATFEGDYIDYQWAGLDPQRTYIVLLDQEAHYVSGADTIDIKVNAGANTTQIIGFNTMIPVTMSLLTVAYASNLHIVQNFTSNTVNGKNVVIRYKLNSNSEVLDAPMYEGQPMYGNYFTLEAWTTPSWFGAVFTQRELKLKTTIRSTQFDKRNSDDYSLGDPTAVVTDFTQNNPDGIGDFNLPITFDQTLINGLAF